MSFELKEGKITLKELANWFDISYEAMRNSKKKRLQTLKAFADYHLEPCGKTGKKSNIIIDKVHCPVYSSAYEEVKKLKPKYWDTHGTGVDTASRVGNEMWRKEKTVNKRIKCSTCERYTGAIEREEYGSLLGEKSKGTKGYRYPIYTKKEYDEKTKEYYYRPLIDEELIVLNEAMKEAKIESTLDSAMFVEEFYKNRKDYNQEELEKAALALVLKQIPEMKYDNFMSIATEKLGFRPVKAAKEVQYGEENAEKAFDFA